MSVLDDIRANHPELIPYLGIPEIGLGIVAAAQDHWTPQQFSAWLQSTNWWKTTPDTARKWANTQLSDPATASQLQNQKVTEVMQLSTALGVRLSPNQLAYFAGAALNAGWATTDLQRQIVDFGRSERLRPGQILATKSQLHATASNYGVAYSDATLNNWASKINDGSQTAAGFEEATREQAKRAFPTLAKELDSGLTVKQIADPYVQIAAQTLGLNPDTVDLTNPKWSRALQSRDKDGKIVGPMTTLDWQRTLMTDNAYGYDQTANGKQAALQLKESLGKQFGLVA